MTALPAARTAVGRLGLERLVAEPLRAVLAVDYDGTLAPIVADPVLAYPQPGAVQALRALGDRLGVLAVLTGRPPDAVLQLTGLAGDPPPGLLVLGHYGAQLWDAASGRSSIPASALPAATRAGVDALLRAASPRCAGTVVEDKVHALAIHTRAALDPAGALQELRAPLTGLAGALGVVLEPGRFVLELRPPGGDKGTALAALVRERGAAAVVFLGDDLGDLAAFDAVEALRAEGVAGATVCSASAEVGVLAERADVVVDGPAGVVRLLQALGRVMAERHG